MKAAALGSHHPAAAGRARAAAVGSRGTASKRGVACSAASSSRRDLLLSTGAAGLLSAAGPSFAKAPAPPAGSIYDFSLNFKGQEVSLEKYRDQALVIVNIASEWPLQNVNYPGLRALYDKYKAGGFNLLAVPCNQFGGQAPGSSDEERAWAFKKFGFEFDVYDTIDVNGPDAHPLYNYLRAAQPVSAPSSQPTRPSGAVEWNYTKFLVDRDGHAVKRYKPGFDPLEAEGDVRLTLARKPVLPQECIMHPGRIVCNVDKILAA